MLSDRAYYDRLKRRYLAAEKDYWDNHDKPEIKDGDDILMEETPSDPSELRQYIEVISVFADEISDDRLRSWRDKVGNVYDNNVWAAKRAVKEGKSMKRQKFRLIRL